MRIVVVYSSYRYLRYIIRMENFKKKMQKIYIYVRDALLYSYDSVRVFYDSLYLGVLNRNII